MRITRAGVKLRTKQIYRRIVRASGTPHEIALGMAVGFFIGWLPIIGIQMAVAVVLCTFLRCNRVVPLFPVWLTNPVTLVPVYSFNYWVGWKLVGGPNLKKVAGAIKNLLPAVDPEGPSFWTHPWDWCVAWLADFWIGIEHNIKELFKMGWEIQLPLWLGCAVTGLTLALLSYYITRWAVARFWERVFHKRRLRAERLLAMQRKAAEREARRATRRSARVKADP